MARSRVGRAIPALALGVSFALGQSAPPKTSRDWKRLRSANFAAVGNASESVLREAVTRLEGFRLTLLGQFPRLQLDSAVPTLMVVFKDDTSFSRFKPRDDRGRRLEGVAGYFLALPDVNYIALGTAYDGEMTFELVFHEYTHYLLYRNVRRLPTWLSEGLAEFYSTIELDLSQGRTIVGRPPDQRVWTISQLTPLRLDQMLSNEGTAKIFENPVQVAMFYAQSWAFVHYVNHGQEGKRRGQLGAYLQGLDAGRSVPDAFAAAFGAGFDPVQKELEAYMRKRVFPAVVIKHAPGALAVREPVEPMLEADALQMQGDLLARLGVDDEAERWLGRALEQDRTHVPSRVSMGIVRAQQDRTKDAIDLLQAVVEADPKNYPANFHLAAAFSKAKKHEEAARVFDRTVALNVKAEQAWFGLSVSEMALGRDAQADAALVQVMRLNSDPRWYRRRMYEALRLRKDAVAARDARAFLQLAGWGGESAPYVALAAVVAGWRLGQPAEVAALVEEAKRIVKTDSWPAALLEFAAGQLPADKLVARAKDDGQRTEARAYVGIKAAVDGRKDEALVHLRWVKEKGRKGYVEYEWALDELKRLESGVTASSHEST
jgi:tetratricopeptide (TPR) repeat protein